MSMPPPPAPVTPAPQQSGHQQPRQAKSEEASQTPIRTIPPLPSPWPASSFPPSPYSSPYSSVAPSVAPPVAPPVTPSNATSVALADAPSVTPSVAMSYTLRWTQGMEQALLYALIRERHAGNRPSAAGFKDRSWNVCMAAVNEHTCQADKPLLNKSRLASKFDSFKKLFKAWDAILKLTGWSLNEKGLPVPTSQAMLDYFNEHKVARVFKTKPLPYQDELYYLFQNKLPTSQDKLAAFQDKSVTSREMPAAFQDKVADDRASDIPNSIVEVRGVVSDSSADEIERIGQSNSRKRRSSITGGRRLQRRKQPAMDQLFHEIWRSNNLLLLASDLLQDRLEKPPPLEKAIEIFDRDFATEFTMHQRLVILESLMSEGNALIFVMSEEARRRAFMELLLKRVEDKNGSEPDKT